MAGMGMRRRKKLKPFADEIVKQCKGVPLAIVSIAGVLAGKQDTAWERASKSVGNILTEASVTTTLKILQSSYRYLPYELKPCFIYLAGFPEEVRARKLIRMWAAEGLLEERGKQSAEEVGEDCPLGLLEKCALSLRSGILTLLSTATLAKD